MSTSSGELTVRITAKTQEALDICAFELRAVHAPSLPALEDAASTSSVPGIMSWSIPRQRSSSMKFFILFLSD